MQENFRQAGRWMYAHLALATILKLTLGTFLILSFYELADEVRDGETLAFDETVLRWFNNLSTPWLDSFFLNVTGLGGVAFVAATGIALTAFMAARRRWRDMWVVIIGLGGAALLNIILKLLFERVRPDLWEQLVVETSFSFPSGHSMASAALAGVIIYFIIRSRLKVWLKSSLIAAAVIYVALVGFSRLYLGVHYPTDVVGGWLVTSLWLLVAIPVIEKIFRSRRSAS